MPVTIKHHAQARRKRCLTLLVHPCVVKRAANQSFHRIEQCVGKIRPRRGRLRQHLRPRASYDRPLLRRSWPITGNTRWKATEFVGHHAGCTAPSVVWCPRKTRMAGPNLPSHLPNDHSKPLYSLRKPVTQRTDKELFGKGICPFHAEPIQSGKAFVQS